MTRTEIANRFNATFKGHKNFMTPDIVRYGKVGRLLYELSSGTGFGGDMAYGVTVIDVKGEKVKGLNKYFDTLEAAEAHINTNINKASS